MLDGRITAFKPTADLDRARQFYGDVLGLRFVQQSPFACVFDVEGTMLRVTAVDTVARPGYTVLGWHVVEVSATIDALTNRGVTFIRYDGMDQDATGVWTDPGGDKIAWFTDPDGNLLSLTEFA